MADWSTPSLTSTYSTFLTNLKARDEDLAKQFDGQTTSNLVTGSIRWNSSINRWQKWSGSAWGELATTYALTGLSTTGNAAIGGTFSVTGVSQLAAGSATAPGLGIGEATTGLFRPSAGVLGVATGGVEAFRVDASGRVGFGFTGSLGGTNGAYRFAASPTGGTSADGIVLNPSFATDVTATAIGLRIQPSTTDGISGLTNLIHYIATQGTISGGTRGAVVNQYGFYVQNNFANATNNYGFFSRVASATGCWNYYASGGAPNYFAGDIRTNSCFTESTTVTNSNTNGVIFSAGTLIGGIRTSTPTADISQQLPTGTNMDAAFQELQVNHGFEWSLINLATAASTWDVTVTANTGHTVVGNMLVKGEETGRFKTVKTAANTFVTYRIA